MKETTTALVMLPDGVLALELSELGNTQSPCCMEAGAWLDCDGCISWLRVCEGVAVDSLGKGAFQRAPAVPDRVGFESGHRPDRVVSGGPGQPEGSRATPPPARPAARPPATPPAALSRLDYSGIAADHGQLRALALLLLLLLAAAALIYLSIVSSWASPPSLWRSGTRFATPKHRQTASKVNSPRQGARGV